MKDLDHSEASDVSTGRTNNPRTPDAYTLLANIDIAKGQTQQAAEDSPAMNVPDRLRFTHRPGKLLWRMGRRRQESVCESARHFPIPR